MSRRPEPGRGAGRGTGRDVPLRSTHIRLRRRLLAAGALLVLGAGLIAWRLMVVQVLEPDRFLARGASQSIRTVPLQASRGAIVDRNGVDLALSLPLPSIVANPRLVDDPDLTARRLATVLDTDVAVMADRLGRDSAFAYLQRQVPPEVAERVTALGLNGVFVREEQARVRPGEASGLAVLGRTDVDGKGISGLELVYDGLLSGVDGEKVVESALDGSTIPRGEYSVEPATDGRTLMLTLDRSLQFEAERLLRLGVEAAGGRGGILMAMDPRTGEVLASATVVLDADGRAVTSGEHRGVTWTYEPGSIVKPLTFAAVLDAAVAAPATVREVPVRVEVHGTTFSDPPPRYSAEDLSVADVVRRSSNVGTILWAADLGAEALHATLMEFGLGRVSPLDFPGESAGSLRSLHRWSGTSLPTIAIGQGIATTPVQMLTAYATIANGGIRPAPTLVLGTREHGGVFTPSRPGRTTTVVPAAVAAEVTAMMEGVVLDGTGTRAAVPGYRVAGKTGTAWKARSEGGYGDEGDRDYVASFAGFLPAEDPRLAVIVVVDEPDLRHYSGGRAAAPIFADFANFAVRRLRIPSESERAGLEVDGRVQAVTAGHQRLIAEAEAAAAADESASAVPAGG